MIDADRVADALEAIMREQPAQLAGALAESLDGYAMARLYCVASARLGRSSAPDPHRYCPWCMAEFADATFAEHLQSTHRAMLEA